jgi:hypothetical protein
VYELLNALDALVRKIGEDNLHNNVIGFFKTLDRCWPVRQLSGDRNEARPHLKPVFLMTLAALFSRYGDFCPDKFVKKLKTFTLSKYVAHQQAPAKEVIYEILRKHLGLDPSFEDFGEAAE